MDFNAICDGLAARFAAATIGTPTGATAMRGAYGQAPNGVPTFPCVVVVPQNGDVTYGAGIEDGQHDIDVNFYYAKAAGDFPRSETQRQLWLPYLLTATNGQMALGLAPTVLKAIPTGYEFAELPYGGETYDGIVVHYRVWTRDSVTLTP